MPRQGEPRAVGAVGFSGGAGSILGDESLRGVPLPEDEAELRVQIKAAFQRAAEETSRLEALLLALAILKRDRSDAADSDGKPAEGSWVVVKKPPGPVVVTPTATGAFSPIQAPSPSPLTASEPPEQPPVRQ